MVDKVILLFISNSEYQNIEVYYLLCRPQVYQLDQGRHFQLGMLCSFQIFLLKSTFQQDMGLVGY